MKHGPFQPQERTTREKYKYIVRPAKISPSLVMAFPVKREADHVGSDFDITPTKKVKVEKKSNSKASPMKWTVEDAKLIKKLREEDGLGWKFCSSPVSQLITEKLRSSSQALKWVQLGKLTIRE